MLLPVVISLFDLKKYNAPKYLSSLDSFIGRIFLFILGLIGVCIMGRMKSIQAFSYLSLFIILFYNGKPGNTKFKYGFYIFYPLHLLILELISILI